MENNRGLSNFNLKIIAIVTMFIDHFAASDVYLIISEHVNLGILGYTSLNYMILRSIGRLAFPIFCFLIAEGFYYTKNRYKYLTRLSIFALIAEVPFDLAFNGAYLEFSYQNIFFTLALGLLLLIVIDETRNTDQYIGFIVVLFISFSLFYLNYNYNINIDYNVYGILMIVLFYNFRGNFKYLFTSILILTLLFNYNNYIQLLSMFSFVFIYFYNNQKGRSLKYFFYIFYPLHLLFFAFIKYVIY